MRKAAWFLIVGLLASGAIGCVAQVRSTRKQQAFYETPENKQETKIALVSVQVPEWVEDEAPDEDPPAQRLKAAIPKAFDGSDYTVVDKTSSEFTLDIGPDTKPAILNNAARVANIGEPYPYDNDGKLDAYSAPPHTWSLVSGPDTLEIDEETGKIDWVPQTAGEVSVTVSANNDKGKDRYSFKVRVLEEKEEIKTSPPGDPRVGMDQTFAAGEPKNVPASVDAPLIMGAHVVDWSEGQKEHMGQMVRTVNSDVVYSLWTRDGEHVETRRVRLSLIPGQGTDDAVELVPNRSIWVQRTWDKAKSGSYDQYASQDESELFKTAANVSARAFAFPFADHQVTFSAQLASNDKLKPGLEKMKNEDWKGAYKDFKKVAKNDKNAAGAHYNMGVVRELQGRTKAAIKHYKKAVSIEEKGLYTRQLDAAKRRHKAEQKLVLPELPEEPTGGAKEVPAGEAAKDALDKKQNADANKDAAADESGSSKPDDGESSASDGSGSTGK